MIRLGWNGREERNSCSGFCLKQLGNTFTEVDQGNGSSEGQEGIRKKNGPGTMVTLGLEFHLQ